MNLATAFLESARKCAGKPAIFWGEEVVTYDDLVAQSRWLAKRLSEEMGVKPGERVITDGMQKVRPGVVVTPAEKSLAAEKS